MDFSTLPSFFTPSVLFVLLNVVIGTIAVISSRRHHRNSHSGGGDHHQQQSPIARSPSFNVMERVRDLGLFRFRSGDLPPVNDDHNDLDNSTTDQNHHQQPQQQQQFRRIQSESDSKKKKKKGEESTATTTTTNNIKMKKSTSEKLEIVRRLPATVDEEVDAKADDFINKFRQQLNLQRLDSLLRYKELLTTKRD